MKSAISRTLRKIYQEREFDTDTLDYRIGGFFDAIGLDLNDKKIQQYGFRYATNPENGKHYVSDVVGIKDDVVDIKICNNTLKQKKWLRIQGSYFNSRFTYDNYFKKGLRRNDLVEIPFKISLVSLQDDAIYGIQIIKKMFCTDIVIDKRRGNETEIFIVTISRNDFEYALRITMKFIESPKDVYEYYKQALSNGPLLSGGRYDMSKVNDDIILDEKGKIYKKVLK